MAKLPAIEYSGVQQSSDSMGQVDGALRDLTGTVSRGLQAIGMEIVKTQNQKAAADLHEGLAAVELDLNSRRYVSTAYVRQQLGDGVDSLPEPVRAQLTRKVRDPEKGEETELERDDIPTWVVSGAIHQKRSDDLVRAASGQISGSGWQAEFQNAARSDLLDRQARFAHQQAAAMLEDQKETQRATVAQYTRLGEHGRALDVIEASDAFTGGEKAILREQVLRAQGDDKLAAVAEAKARELEAKHPDSPTVAMDEALALGGALGPKVAERLKERDNLRTEAIADQVRKPKDHLEVTIRSGRIRTLDQLEGTQEYKGLPDGPRADLVQVLNGENERRARLAQMQGDKEWAQELARFQGLSDREKVSAWPTYQEKIPFAYQGGFAQTFEAARVRLTNAWESEDVQKTFELATGVLKWNTGNKKANAELLKLRGRRWYDEETRRRQGVPPTLPEAAQWLAKALQYGDENGDAWGGGPYVYRFQAEAMAEKAGQPLQFEPFSAENQKFPPAAGTLGAPGSGSPAAQPPAGGPAATPALPSAPVGARVQSEALGFPPGGVFEMQSNGKWKRIQ
jgi:hypothetical protein